MELEETKKSQNVTDFAGFEQQVALINGQFKLPKGSTEIMNLIRGQIQAAAQTVLDAMKGGQETGAVKVDARFLEQGLMELQAAKDKLCCAVIIPYAEPKKV